MDAPAGKRLAPFLPEIVARLRACGELEITEEVAGKLTGMSAATIDRRLAGERKRLAIKGRSGTKPGSTPLPEHIHRFQALLSLDRLDRDVILAQNGPRRNPGCGHRHALRLSRVSWKLGWRFPT
jgi:hypothetical protein